MKVTQATELPPCRLCQEQPANQTGSHIFNSALIKGAINARGETKREKEMSYTIMPGRGVETYFGRELSINKIEEALGREMSEAEVEANINPYTVDHLLCSNCEKRIERVERYFMDNVYSDLKKGKLPTTKLMRDLSVTAFTRVNVAVVRLYFYSLVWRAVETKFGNCSSKEKEREFLRRVLDDNLDIDVKKVMDNAENNKEEVCKLPLIINYFTTTGDSSKNVIYVGKRTRPYFFVLNDISFQLFFDKKHINSHIELLWGLYKFQKVKELINSGSDELIIGIVSENFIIEVFRRNLSKFLSLIELRSLSNDFSRKHRMIFGYKPTREDAKELHKEYTDESVPDGIRYSEQRRIEVVLSKIIEIAKKKGYKEE